MALADKYGNVVSSLDGGKISFGVDTDFNNDNSYPPTLSGILDYESVGGVFNVSDISFTSNPGNEFSIHF